MIDLHEGVLAEFAERAVQGPEWPRHGTHVFLPQYNKQNAARRASSAKWYAQNKAWYNAQRVARRAAAKAVIAAASPPLAARPSPEPPQP